MLLCVLPVRFYNKVDKTYARFLNPGVTLGLVNPRLVSYPEFAPGLKDSKTLFSLNPGVTRDSRVTPGLPLDSKTGHECYDCDVWL